MPYIQSYIAIGNIWQENYSMKLAFLILIKFSNILFFSSQALEWIRDNIVAFGGDLGM
jgi:hypothetical protein